MSYLVLARKYRPQNFADLVGQEHVAEILSQAIQNDRVAHAYLLCGPRGVGKTSCARILAKSLNCEKGPTLTPCEECSSCKEIAKGTSFDVLEIDGASNRGIDEIRALRENVKFAPSYGRYKIYIVDEVHMLTAEAFNALLKTLEEPPPHVKFIFATTAVQKVPATILSRCQRFDFKRIPLKTIIEHLQTIGKKENLNIDEDALYAVAKSSDGGLRDALSILDQMGAIHDRQIKADDVYSMLGQVELGLIFDISDAIGQKNPVEALSSFEKILNKGKDIRQLMKDITDHFRHLMIIKIGGKTLSRLVDYAAPTKEKLLEQSQLFSVADILRAIDVFISAQETARITESDQLAFEMALAKLTYAGGEIEERVAMKVETRAAPQPAAPAPKPIISKFSTTESLKNQKGQVDVSPVSTQKSESPSVSESHESDERKAGLSDLGYDESDFKSEQNISLEKIRSVWSALTHAVSREKMSLATYLQEGVPTEFKEGRIVVGFLEQYRFHKESLETQANVKLVETVFSQKLHRAIAVQYRIVTESKPLAEENHVKSALDTFQGKVVSRWHNE